MARVRVDLRGLYLAAFQSALWNRMLAALMRETCAAEQLADEDVGGGVFAKQISSEGAASGEESGIVERRSAGNATNAICSEK